MTRFFFDTGADGDVMRDDTGLELPDLEAARLEAIRVLPGIAQNLLGHNSDQRQDITAGVRGTTGHLLFTARLVLEVRRLD